MFDSISSEVSKKEPSSPRSIKDTEKISLDKIICDYGYGIEVWKIIICTILVYILVGYSTTIFPTLLTAYSSYFNLTNGNISFIGFIYFIFKAVGALFAGHLTIMFKSRLSLAYTCGSILFFTNILLALTMSKYTLFIERILSGFVSGVFEPLINNLLCEYLPIYLRGFTLLAVWAGYNFGQLYPNLIMLGTMPHYDPNGIAKTLLFCSTVHLICIIVCAFILNDSPRNYILHEEDEKAFKILEKMREGRKLAESEKRSILRGVKEGVNKDAASVSIWDIFKPEYVALTIFISILSFVADLIYDGPVLIMTLTLTTVEGNKAAICLLRDNIIVILFALPSSFFGGMCMEMKFFGRKRTIFLSFLCLFVAMVFALIFVNHMYIFLGIYQFFANYGSIMIAIYCSEVFPSRIRDFSVGLSVFFSNFGSAVSQYIFISLRSYNNFAPYYFTILCCIIGCVISCLLSVETYQRPLDVSHGHDNMLVEDNTNQTGDDETTILIDPAPKIN